MFVFNFIVILCFNIIITINYDYLLLYIIII